MSARDYLAQLLEQQLTSDAWQWARSSAEMIGADGASQLNERQLFLRFSAAVRHSPKNKLDLDSVTETHGIDGWQARHWRLDHALRVFLLLHLPALDGPTLRQLLDRMFQAADLGEAEALYLAIPLLPHPEQHIDRATEGLRSNVKSLFEAVAHYSPFPAAHFDGQSWNQMVLKSLFIESALDPIYGLEQRSNPQLTRMLCDYAHERWAASRSISPELWRCVGACPDANALSDLTRILNDGATLEQQAVALSVFQSPMPAAQALLDPYPELHKQLTQGLCWADILANP